MTGTEQAFRPSTSKPERGSSWRGMAIMAALIALVFIGAGAVYVFGGEADDRRGECVEALDAAEELIGAAVDSFGLIEQALEALSQFDLDRVEDLANQLDAETVRDLRAAYDDKAKECRG